MCGIFGYSGEKECNDLIFEGLKRLEYRGYDSWGIAILNGKIHQYKNIGEIKYDKMLQKLQKGNIGIGHTRWATHGGVTKINAHPHISEVGGFTLVQNGIVENFNELKSSLLKKDVHFVSETDTEVIVRLIELELLKNKSLRQAIITVFKKLKGRNTIALLSNNDKKIYAVRNGSPLVLGIATDGIYIASDTLSFSPATNEAVLLDDFDMVEIDGKNVSIYNIESNQFKPVKIKKLKHQFNKIEKGNFKHFMLKEIIDQKETILFATKYLRKELLPLTNSIKKGGRVYVIGAGTAGFSAGQIAYFLRNIANIDAQEVKSYEFEQYISIVKKKDVLIAISQSGETADTIEAIEAFRKKGCKIASLVNMYGTTISRLSDFEFYTNSGPEICVASTKVFTAQCAWGYLLAMTLDNRFEEGKKNLSILTKSISQIFLKSRLENIKRVANKLKNKEHAFILGKGENSYIALEGALKIKEISYKHVEGFAAGELKHGVIALIEKGTPVLSIIPSEDSCDFNDMISAVEQVKARGALTIGIGNDKSSKREIFDFYINVSQVENVSSIANVIPFQLISYYLSVALGNNIDKPRNLAKSVTVK